VLSSRSRSVTPSISQSLTDSIIFYCNRRLRGLDRGAEELRLWEIAKEIGVVCQVSEESIIQRFSEMEERDNFVVREASREEGNRSS